MSKKLKLISFVILTYLTLNLTVEAAPAKADANAKAAMAKLQAMVKDATTARDTLKTEKDKISAELEQIKKEKDITVLERDRLNSDLDNQKSTNASVTEKLDQTHLKLLEVIEKYNALNKSKNELTVLHSSLENNLKQTETNLNSCESKNLRLYEAGKEILSSYENKNVLDSVLKDEPIFKFKSVEMEAVVQEYEDKIRNEKYKHKEIIENTHK
jgi:uncharacterized protein (DUF3084 family)